MVYAIFFTGEYPRIINIYETYEDALQALRKLGDEYIIKELDTASAP